MATRQPSVGHLLAGDPTRACYTIACRISGSRHDHPFRLFAVCCLPLLAHAAAPVDGVYVTERGWGVLSVKAGAFKLDAMGGNAHTCRVEGKLNAQGVSPAKRPAVTTLRAAPHP